MTLRDIARDIAKLSDKDRRLDICTGRKEILCTKLQKEDRTGYYKRLYNKLETDNDAAEIFHYN